MHIYQYQNEIALFHPYTRQEIALTSAEKEDVVDQLLTVLNVAGISLLHCSILIPVRRAAKVVSDKINEAAYFTC